MEAGDLYQVFNSSSLWWEREQASFSRSFREDYEDEEALKWAALERLQTYSFLKKGLLTTTEGTIEVDVSKLELQERKNFVDRLVKDTEEDNEKFLLKLRECLDSYFS